MRNASPAILLSAMLYALPAAAGTEEDRLRIERAREALKERLSEAHSEGVVVFKDDNGAAIAPRAVVSAPVRDVDAKIPMPELRDGERKLSSCLTSAMLNDVANEVGDDVAAQLRRRTRALAGASDEDRDLLELALAETYLVIGFAEEAAAMAANRQDARGDAIARLAQLMMPPPVKPSNAGARFVGCGPLYRLIAFAEQAREGGDAQIDDEAVAVLKSLPPRVAEPIVRLLIFAAVDQQDNGLANKLRELLPDNSKSVEEQKVDALIDASLAMNGEPPSADVKSLIDLSSAPGPLQARAIEALAPIMAASEDESAARAFENDLEDAVSSSRPPEQARLSLLLADRHERSGELMRAVRDLAKAASADASAKPNAVERLRRLLAAGLEADDEDSRLRALAAVAANADAAGAALDDATALKAGEAFAAFGAVDALSGFLSKTRIGTSATQHLQAKALLRAGAAGDALELARKNASDKAWAETLFRASALSGDPAALRESEVTLTSMGRGDLAAQLSALHGDWRGVEQRLTQITARKMAPEEIELMLTASLALGRAAPPPAIEALLREHGAMAPIHMFEEPPTQVDRLGGFGHAMVGEIAYLREEIADE
jgi:hypothetical protein